VIGVELIGANSGAPNRQLVGLPGDPQVPSGCPWARLECLSDAFAVPLGCLRGAFEPYTKCKTPIRWTSCLLRERESERERESPTNLIP
jgi:hypothetical protein